MATDELIVALADGILRLTINRPDQRNALSLAVLDQIGAALKSHSTIDDVKLAIITGAGDRCFAAGGDLKELDAVRSEGETRMMADRGRAALDEGPCTRRNPDRTASQCPWDTSGLPRLVTRYGAARGSDARGNGRAGETDPERSRGRCGEGGRERRCSVRRLAPGVLFGS